MKRNLKRLLSFALAISLLFCLAACGGGENSSNTGSSNTGASSSDNSGTSSSTQDSGEKISSKDTLTMVSPYTDTGNYNTWTQATAQAATVTRNIMEPLIRNMNGEYVGVLAESFKWEDDTTLTLKIRDNVYFHNGDKMTIDDVIFSNELSRKAASSAGAWKMVESIEAVDETTVKYTLSYADVDFLQALAGNVTSQKYYEEVGEQQFGLKPIGTGYFMWDSYTSGDNVTMKAFDKYWGDHGTIKTLIVRFISENSQALIELENGNVDWITADGSTVASAQGNEAITIVQHGNGLNEYCGFNFNSEKVKDLKVRQALAYAIDREAVVAGAREGIGTASWGLVPDIFEPEYNEEVKNYYQHDPEKAKELLSEAGYSESNPLELTLLTDTSSARTLEAQQIKNMADAVGFKINIATFESATVTSILAGGDAKDYDLFVRALGQQTSTTHQMGTIFSVGATEVGNNPFWFTRDSVEGLAEYDDLFKEIKKTTDDAARYEKMKELQIKERDMVLTCWLVNQQVCEAISTSLKGYIITPGAVILNECYFVEE